MLMISLIIPLSIGIHGFHTLQKLFHVGKIHHTDLIRTTESRHKTAVHKLWVSICKVEPVSVRLEGQFSTTNFLSFCSEYVGR